ncbi:response regulator transcription factor [Paenibacillus sp. CGMCC 1.16610]|uniref:Response regulator n=1 Tax=Paenibacillus anseongense TaxID=2682845 RepID=A0ABW9U809_9BACL|nr:MULTISPECIES: response regulator transcription factor [Paenibacillus]MBA2937157.1 response regulator transcription factor [Paenibacillus sp. CGMCC 1.16610]MVQ36219.1 response regulator [Paenibacillus anseongense]
MIRVMVVDDQRLFREGLSTIIRQETDIEVIDTASNGREAYEIAIVQKPDVVIMDIRMPIMDGIEGTRLIRSHLIDVKVLILTTFDDSELIFTALDQGAHGYLLKDIPSEAIVNAIHTVYLGGMVFQPDITNHLLSERKKHQSDHAIEGAISLSKDPRVALLNLLSDREVQVLKLLGQGLNNKEIADELVITEGTVKNHVSNVIAKLEFRDRTQVAIFAVKEGIVPF